MVRSPTSISGAVVQRTVAKVNGPAALTWPTTEGAQLEGIEWTATLTWSGPRTQGQRLCRGRARGENVRLVDLGGAGWTFSMYVGKTAFPSMRTQNHHLAVVQWLHANRTEGCSVNAMDGAARNGHLAVVQWLFANRKEGFTPGAMDSAAEHGHLDVVIWLHASRREGCTTDAMDCAEAQFEADLKGVEAAFDVDEDTFRSKEPMFSLTTTWIDLAAIYGSSYLSDAHASMDLIGEEHRVSCSVSGLYGAILRGHLGNVKQIHKRQRELGNWPALEDGADAIRSLMSPVKRKDRLLS